MIHLHEAKLLSVDLAELKAISGRNAKEEYAEEHFTEAYHRLLLDLVGNNKRQWYTTWKGVTEATPQGHDLDLDDVLDDAEKRRATPAQTAGRIRSKLNEGWPENVLKAIIEKTLDAGITVKTIKDMTGGGAKFGCALCADWLKMKPSKRETLLKTRRYVSTPKMDGLRCLFKVNMADEGVYSRNLKPILNQGHILKILKEVFKGRPGAIDGEILSVDNTWESSMTAAKKAGSTVATRFYPFDWVPASEIESGKYLLTSQQRYDVLTSTVPYGDESLFVHVVRTPVSSVADAVRELNLNLEDGWEGCVLHDLDAPYSTKRSLNWIKIKTFVSSEFVITGFVMGTGKHLGRLGAFVVEGIYEGTRVKSEVGTGFSDQEREEIWNNKEKYVGQRAEIKFFNLTPDGSLRFPSFLRLKPEE